MFLREWRKLRKQYSWQPLGGLVILALLAGVMLDLLWSDFDQVAQRLERVETELRVSRKKAERLPAMELQGKQLATEYGGVQARLIPAQGDSAAGEKFGQLLRGWYEAKGVNQVAVRAVQRREAGGLVYYRADIEAAMRIEQLVDLLQGKPYAPVVLSLVEASVKANDEVSPTGLQTTMMWEGLLSPAKPEEATAGKPAARPGKGQRTVSRVTNENPTASKIIEEKRK